MSFPPAGSERASRPELKVDIPDDASAPNRPLAPPAVKKLSAQLRSVFEDVSKALPQNSYCIKLLAESTKIEEQRATRVASLTAVCGDFSVENIGHIDAYAELEAIHGRLKALASVGELSRLDKEGNFKVNTNCECQTCQTGRSSSPSPSRSVSPSPLPRGSATPSSTPRESFANSASGLLTPSKLPAPRMSRSKSSNAMEQLKTPGLDTDKKSPSLSPSKLRGSAGTLPRDFVLSPADSSLILAVEKQNVSKLPACLRYFYISFLKLGGMDALIQCMNIRSTWIIRGLLLSEIATIQDDLHNKIHLAVLNTVGAFVDLVSRELTKTDKDTAKQWWNDHQTLLARFCQRRALRLGNRRDFVTLESLEAILQIITEGRAHVLDALETYNSSGNPQLSILEFPASLKSLFVCLEQATPEDVERIFKQLTLLFVQVPANCSLVLRTPQGAFGATQRRSVKDETGPAFASRHWQDLIWPYVVQSVSKDADKISETSQMALAIMVVVLCRYISHPRAVETGYLSFTQLFAESVNRLLVVTGGRMTPSLHVRRLLRALISKVAKVLRPSMKDVPDHQCWEPFLQLLEISHVFAWYGTVPGQTEFKETKEVKEDMANAFVSKAVVKKLKFSEVVAEEHLLEAFKKYVQAEGFQKEELLFWLAVHDYQECRVRYMGFEERLAKALKVYATFLEVNSPEELQRLSLSDEERAQTKKALEDDHKCEVFDELQAQAADAMETGVFAAFLDSEPLQEALLAKKEATAQAQREQGGRLHVVDEKVGIHSDNVGTCLDLPLLSDAMTALHGIGRTADGKDNPAWSGPQARVAKQLLTTVQNLRDEIQAGQSYLETLEKGEVPTKKAESHLATYLSKRLPEDKPRSEKQLMITLSALFQQRQGLLRHRKAVSPTKDKHDHTQRPNTDYSLKAAKSRIPDLISSEEQYVSDLMNCSSHYLTPMVDAPKLKITNRPELARFAANTQQITTLHGKLLKELRRAEESVDLIPLFQLHIPFFKLYYSWAQAYSSLLIGFDDQPEVWRFIGDAEVNCGLADFRTLVSRPLSRISEYATVLEAIDAVVPEGHECLEPLQTCLTGLRGVQTQISDNKKDSENSAQLLRLHMLVKGIPDNWNVLGPTRLFLQAGVCTELFPGDPAREPPKQHPAKSTVRLLLLDDALAFTKWDYEYCSRVDLETVTDIRARAKLVLEVWTGLHAEDSRPGQALLFDTQKDRDRWQEAILAARGQRIQRLQELGIRGDMQHLRQQSSRALIASVMTPSPTHSPSGEFDHADLESTQMIKVCMRVRPFVTDVERRMNQTCITVDGRSRVVTLLPGPQGPQQNRVGCYDHVFVQSTTQNEIFETLGRETLGAIFAGSNVCILAFGNTGSGKTYTMFGPGIQGDAAKTSPRAAAGKECMAQRDGAAIPATVHGWEADTAEVKVTFKDTEKVVLLPRSAVSLGAEDTRGLIPRVLEWLFTILSDPSYVKVKVKLSYMQIYNERINDLQAPHTKNGELNELKLSQNRKGQHEPKDLIEREVKNLSEAMAIIEIGNMLRVTKFHNMHMSSRSHAIVVVTIRFTNAAKKKTRSRVHLIDLAGSETLSEDAQGDAAAQALMKEESKYINQSLESLGRVVFTLAENQKRSAKSKVPVPFRESKLTMLLMGVLTGHYVCTLILNVSPSPANNQRVLSGKTMAFGEGIKRLNPDAKSGKSKDDKTASFYTGLWNAVSRGR